MSSSLDQRARPTPRRRRSRLGPGLILVLLGTVFAVVVFTLLRGRARAGQGMPDHSVYSNAPDGLAQAGVQRVVPLGRAAEALPGLPHDGMYPLHRLLRWVVDEEV